MYSYHLMQSTIFSNNNYLVWPSDRAEAALAQSQRWLVLMSLYPVLSLSIGSRWGPPLPKLMIVTESAGVGVVGELSPVRLVSCQLAAKVQ